MLKILGFALAAAVVIGLVVSGIHLFRVAAKNKKEMAQFESGKIAAKPSLGKVLVVYYSLSGHTRDIAERIQKQTGADLFELKTAEPLGSGPAMYLKIKQQLKKGQYPQLAVKLPDIQGYDTVFVGAPVWWYTMATPLWSFLERADFSGKKVVPFSTQGSNYGTFFEDFEKKAKNAHLLKGESFNNLPEKYNEAVDNKIAAWLNKL